MLDNKIPAQAPDKGLEGSAEVQAGTAAGMSAGAFSLTTATPLKNDNGQLVLHAEGVARNAGDYRVGGLGPEQGCGQLQPWQHGQ
ncbi:hypothetical protein J4711_13535 [Staphylococcus epidermidis]|nr:hypothetical protein [Staphylococcus epidermidis]